MNKLIRKLKTTNDIEEKSIILDEITSKARKKVLSNIISTIVSNLVYTAIYLCFSFYIIASYIVKDGINLFESHNPILSKLLCLFEEWNKWDLKALPLMLIGLLLAIIAFIFSILIIKFMFIFIKMPSYKTDGKSMKEKSKQVYFFVQKKSHTEENCSIGFVIAISIIIVAIVLFSSVSAFSSDLTGFKRFDLGVLCPLLFGLIAYFPCRFTLPYVSAICMVIGGISADDVNALLAFWLENDPEEKRQRETQKIEQEIAESDAQKKREYDAIRATIEKEEFAKKYNASKSDDDFLDDLGSMMAEDYGSDWSSGM